MKKIKSIISILLVSMMLFAVAAAGIGSASAAETNYNGGIIQYTVTDGKAAFLQILPNAILNALRLCGRPFS